MNRNTAKSYGKPLEGGGGTVCPIPIAWPIDACRFAGGSRSRAVVGSLTLDRERTASANSVNTVCPISKGKANIVRIVDDSCCNRIEFDPFTSENACANGVSASRAEQSRAEQSRAEQSRAEQSRAEQSRASNPLLRKSFPASCDEHVSYLDSTRKQFHYASCADISGSGRLFSCSFPPILNSNELNIQHNTKGF